jgi:hypothetical protein
MHLTNVLKVSKELGAKGIEGEAYLELGRLHMFKNQNSQAKDCLLKTTAKLKDREAELFLKQANEILASVKYCQL